MGNGFLSSVVQKTPRDLAKAKKIIMEKLENAKSDQLKEKLKGLRNDLISKF